ncbi:hypothetical protein C8D78_1365 [Arthrobacter oryzae]|uniref:Uncharacterized protein n=1 Tax=Arthrobacter oryzae TaxID=409290 RepID=A0A495EVS5_9MICC|nr:hypothetical protein C8D78_1365 [Arthrobacter oryzae]
MKPLDISAAPETGLRRAGGAVGLAPRLPASESGTPFPILPCQLPGRDAAVRRRLIAGGSHPPRILRRRPYFASRSGSDAP